MFGKDKMYNLGPLGKWSKSTLDGGLPSSLTKEYHSLIEEETKLFDKKIKNMKLYQFVNILDRIEKIKEWKKYYRKMRDLTDDY